MTVKPTLLILAAGRGSRYGGLKQIEPVGPHGETIMDYSIYDAVRAGFGKLVFVIRSDIEAPFKETVGARYQRHIPVDYVFQELHNLPAGFSVPPDRSKPWGTGHAILSAAQAVHEPFAAINADDFYGAQSFTLLSAHLSSGSEDYAMVGYTLRNTLSDFGSVARGICQMDAAGCLQTVVELTKIERAGSGATHTNPAGGVTRFSGDEAVSMNFWGFTPGIFAQLQTRFVAFLKRDGGNAKAEFYIPTAVNDLVAAGEAKVRVLRTHDAWFGVTYREDRPRVVQSIRKLISRGDYPEKLWS